MLTITVNNKYFPLLAVVAIVLVTASFLLHPNEEAIYFRGLRSLVSLILLGVIIFSVKTKNKYIVGFCLLYSISSLLTIWFEHRIVSVVSMLVNTLSVMFLIRMIFKKIRFKKMSKLFLIALIFVTSVNAWLMYSFMFMLEDLNIHFPLLLAISLVSLSFFVVTILAFVHTNESHSPSSIVFIFFLIFLMFAEMFRGVGYYDFIDSIYGQYAARVLLVIAFSILSYFSLLEKKNALL